MCLVEYGMPALGPDRKPVLNADGTPKIAKMPRPAISCATPISPGMEIYTTTPAVKQMREGVLESLLINHPLDCPICDQAGECKLQEYSVDYGQSASRFVEAKVHKPKAVDLGPRIMLDAERCILCTRCIRFTKDIAGDDALGIINRGSFNTIATFPGMPFDNNYTLNTVDICPVGALTSKDFRFKMRVWFLKETKSLCTSCGTGCNVLVSSREEKIQRYTPRENDAVNGPWMCDAGRLNYKWIGRDDRLKEVLVRGQKSTWTAALNEISDKLKKSQAGSVAIVASARQTNEELAADFQVEIQPPARSATPSRGLAKATNCSSARIKIRTRTERGSQEFVSRKSVPTCRRLRTVSRAEKLKRWLFSAKTSRSTASARNCSVNWKRSSSATFCRMRPRNWRITFCPAARTKKRGSFTNTKGRVQKFMKAVEAPGDARAEWEFLHDLVFNVTGQNGFVTIEGLFNAMAADVSRVQRFEVGKSWATPV